MFSRPTKKQGLLLVCALALFALPGCGRGEMSAPVKVYPNCYSPIERYNQTNRGVSSLAFDHIKRSTNPSDRRIMYVSTMNDYINVLDLEAGIARTAAKCYNDSFVKAVEDYKSNRISKADLVERYTEITSGMTESTGVLGSVLQKARAVSQKYNSSYNDESSRLKLTAQEIKAMLYVNSQTAKVKADRRLVRCGSPVAVGPAPKDEFGKVKTAWADTDSVTKKVTNSEYKQLSDMAEWNENMDYFIIHLEAEQKIYVLRIQQMKDIMTSFGL